MISEKRRLWKLVLFTLPTLGIYNIYFWFRLTKDLNEMNREEKKIKNYFLVLFLTLITFGIYRWYWLFCIEDRLQVTGEQMGIKVHPGPGAVLFFWTFGKFVLFGPFLADYFIIHNMNHLAKEYNASLGKKTKVVDKEKELPLLTSEDDSAKHSKKPVGTANSKAASTKSANPTVKKPANSNVKKPGNPNGKKTGSPNGKKPGNPNGKPANPNSKKTVNPNGKPANPNIKKPVNPNGKPANPSGKKPINSNGKPKAASNITKETNNDSSK